MLRGKANLHFSVQLKHAAENDNYPVEIRLVF